MRAAHRARAAGVAAALAVAVCGPLAVMPQARAQSGAATHDVVTWAPAPTGRAQGPPTAATGWWSAPASAARGCEYGSPTPSATTR